MLTFHSIFKRRLIIINKRVCKEDQIKLIMKCRQRGLSAYQWCQQNSIYPEIFYNWVSKLKKSGYSFPDHATQSEINLSIQGVVKFVLWDTPTMRLLIILWIQQHNIYKNTNGKNRKHSGGFNWFHHFFR